MTLELIEKRLRTHQSFLQNIFTDEAVTGYIPESGAYCIKKFSPGDFGYFIPRTKEEKEKLKCIRYGFYHEFTDTFHYER